MLASKSSLFHWPYMEIYTARRHDLVTDKIRSRVHTTAASLLNLALFHGHTPIQSFDHDTGGSGKSLEEATTIYRGRTAIALYYLAYDEEMRSPQHVAHSSSLPRVLSDPDEEVRDETQYQRELREQYPELYNSGLLQEMMLAPAPTNTFVVDVYGLYGSPVHSSDGLVRVSQDLLDSNVVYKDSVSISLHYEAFPYLSPSTSLAGQTTVLSFSSIASPSSPAHRTRHMTSPPVSRLVPNLPLILIDEAYSLSLFLERIETSPDPKTPTSTLSLSRFIDQSQQRKNVHGPDDMQELLKFFNLSLIVRLGHRINETKFPSSSSSSLAHSFTDQTFVSYARQHLSSSTRTRIRETLRVFETFDEELAVLVSRVETKWTRWNKTTDEHDHHGVCVGEDARERWEEWKEVVRLLKLMLDTPSLEAHIAVSRQAVG